MLPDGGVFEFMPVEPRKWKGRYRHPMGEESTYHAGANGAIEVRWRDLDHGYRFDCPLESCAAVTALTRAVNDMKRRRTGWPGGSFLINEFGQVICPVQNSSDRFLVGEVKGTLLFQDPWDDLALLSVNDADGLRCGDEWKRPYMGLQYQLHAGDQIYYWHDETQKKLLPIKQDRELIDKLRDIRPNGSVRFIVNQYGIVLTKRPVGRNVWRPVYVGRINYGFWFQREE